VVRVLRAKYYIYMIYVQELINALELSSHDCDPEMNEEIREVAIGGRMIDVEELCRPVPSERTSSPVHPQTTVSTI